MKNIKRCVVIVFLLLSVVSFPVNVYSCGPNFPEAIFVLNRKPDVPIDSFFQGNLGIVQKEYSSIYLYIAYRYFNGKEFSDKEQEIVNSLNDEQGRWWLDSDAYKRWLEARAKVVGSGTDPQYPVDAEVQSDAGRTYQFYLNITDDAFHVAAQTLEKYIMQFGVQSPAVASWLKAQENVFMREIPPPADPDLPTSIQKDRAYQIAAAHFYQCNFNVAESLFTAISRDSSSPWNKLSRYLVARAIIRNATLLKAEEDSIFEKAENHLQEILRDASMKEFHSASQRLLNFCMFRTKPKELFSELDGRIMASPIEEAFQTEWRDYSKLLRQIQDSSFIAGFDFPDWLMCFSGRYESSAFEHSYKRWLATQSPAWLAASLANARPTSHELPNLFKAIDSISADEPVYPTLIYWKIRLLIGAGKNEEATKLVDPLLVRSDISNSQSNTNLLLTERARMASSYEEFLKYCHLTPYGIDWGDGDELDYKDSVELFSPIASVLNRYVPLYRLSSACKDPSLPANLRSSLVRATWVRAVLLENENVSLEVTPLFEELNPEVRPFLEQYRSESDKDARRFTAVYFLLKFPGLKPHIQIGVSRSTPLNKINDLRDNWWYPNDLAIEASDADVYCYSYNSSRNQNGNLSTNPAPSFITKADRQTAMDETKKLSSLPGGPNFLIKIVNKWANDHPQDTRVPEALHLAVRASRFGCHDEMTSKLSKEAFKILHKQYAKTIWAEQTKYYY